MYRSLRIRWAVWAAAAAMLLLLTAACTKEVIKEVPVERIIKEEVIREVPVEVVVEKEVVKEVPVEKVVVKEVPVEKIVKEIVEVEKEVIKEVPVEVVVEKEVVKIVEVEKPIIVREEVVREVEKQVIQPVEVVKDLGWMPRAIEGNPKYGGIIRLAFPHRMQHFDFHQGSPAYSGQTSIYNNLVYYNAADGLRTIVPDLAKTWDISADAKTYTFKLREGVKWHDGVDFSADDVAATFTRIIDPPAGLAITATKLYESLSKVEAVDELTVRFSLKNPTPWLIELLASDNYFDPAVIYPKHYMEANNFDLRAEMAPGTGAFKLVEIRKDEYWDLEANPDYFVPYLPYADGVRLVHVVPFCDRGLAVITGQADFTWNTCGDVVQRALDHPDFDALRNAGDAYLKTVVWNNSKAPFDDPRVRRAIHLAYDRDAYNRMEVAASGKQPQTTAWTANINAQYGLSTAELANRPGYRLPKDEDIAEARRLMADAGYPDGFDLDFVISPATGGSVYVLLHEAQFKETLNIRLKFKEIAQVEMGPTLAAGDYNLIDLGTLQMNALDMTPTFNNELTCGAPKNWSRYCNPEFDAVVAKLNLEMDPAKRYKLFRQVDDILDANPPLLLIGLAVNDPVWARYFKGLNLQAWTWVQYQRFETGWLDR